uniref:Uncharacterized protein n=1 Tax=Anguilla anguilla TaxID=7936 RepID=A0A0E9Q1B4_ANGAN
MSQVAKPNSFFFFCLTFDPILPEHTVTAFQSTSSCPLSPHEQQ